MTPHYEDAGLRLFHGSNLEVLPTFPDGSFDSVVTDPPYELGFMGKSWDSSGIAYDVDMWRECLRVLKPGGYLLAFGGTRTWHRIAVAIEDAGFEVRDSIAWMYGSGFPKSMNVSAAIDKQLGGVREVVGVAADFARDGSRRKTDGTHTKPHSKQGGHGHGDRWSAPVTMASTDEAKAWEGWGTALKPAFEPIIVARKPLAGTVAANVLEHGTGGLNIDACRVATDDKLGGGSETRGRTMNGGWDRPWMHDEEAVEASAARARAQVEKAEALGRFPANVLLDESQAAALDEQSGILTSGLMKARTERAPRPGGKIYGADKRNIPDVPV